MGSRAKASRHSCVSILTIATKLRCTCEDEAMACRNADQQNLGPICALCEGTLRSVRRSSQEVHIPWSMWWRSGRGCFTASLGKLQTACTRLVHWCLCLKSEGSFARIVREADETRVWDRAGIASGCFFGRAPRTSTLTGTFKPDLLSGKQSCCRTLSAAAAYGGFPNAARLQ